MNTKLWAIVSLLALAGIGAQAAQFGAFGSRWDQKDGDDVYGGGILLLFDALPLEVRGTYYESANVKGLGDVRALPVDAGLSIGLTHSTAVHVSLFGGGSYAFIDADNDNVDNELGWYAGGRLEIPVSGTSLFGEFFYRAMDLEDTNADLSGTVIDVGFLF